jgi:hypothetical protein
MESRFMKRLFFIDEGILGAAAGVNSASISADIGAN